MAHVFEGMLNRD